jgi:phage terminase large subunit
MPGYGAAVEGKYQGQEYDWLFIDEATQFLESEFRGLAAIVRGANKIPKRVYLTCNPGGPGHNWVKRLFIDKKYKAGEKPEDYVFIKATVDDNKDLMESNPDYVQQLELLPEDKRNAHRYGDWNALAGTYFSEFTDGVHTCRPFQIPKDWARYRAFDYGLDMFFCLWIAVDPEGRCYVYKHFAQSDLVVSDAAVAVHENTTPDENISFTIAPPDMWSRQRETGKTQAAMFAESGLLLFKADNSRKQGWAALKELLKVRGDGKPSLIIFNTCDNLIECMKCLMHDDNDPNDVSKRPHEITHGPDALRYFAQTYVLPGGIHDVEVYDDDDTETVVDIRTSLCGTGVSRSYIGA